MPSTQDQLRVKLVYENRIIKSRMDNSWTARAGGFTEGSHIQSPSYDLLSYWAKDNFL